MSVRSVYYWDVFTHILFTVYVLIFCSALFPLWGRCISCAIVCRWKVTRLTGAQYCVTCRGSWQTSVSTSCGIVTFCNAVAVRPMYVDAVLSTFMWFLDKALCDRCIISEDDARYDSPDIYSHCACLILNIIRRWKGFRNDNEYRWPIYILARAFTIHTHVLILAIQDTCTLIYEGLACSRSSDVGSISQRPFPLSSSISLCTHNYGTAYIPKIVGLNVFFRKCNLTAR